MAAGLRLTDGVIDQAAISFFGMGPTPTRAKEVETQLIGQRVAELDLVEIGHQAVAGLEPPGDIHTLMAGPEGMTTLFVTDGVLQFFDADDRLDHEDNVFSRYQGYIDHCRDHGLEPVDLAF